jgi:hypothetical protein
MWQRAFPGRDVVRAGTPRWACRFWGPSSLTLNGSGTTVQLRGDVVVHGEFCRDSAQNRRRSDTDCCTRKRTAWVPSREKAGRLPSAGGPYDSPQCVFRRNHAKLAPIWGFLIAFLRVLETADSVAEGAGFELTVRFLAKGARESGSMCGICGKR